MTEPVAELRCEDEELRGRTFDLRAGENRVGRAPDNDVILPSPWVSRYHATLVWDEGVLVIVPVGDKRVAVNGEVVTGAELRPDDVIQLGQTLLRVALG